MAQFLEDAEQKITHEEQQKAMREKLAKFNKDHAGSGGKAMPKSILKKPPVDATAIKMPAHLSKARRAPVQIEDQQIQEQAPVTEEQEARLTTEQISDGVQKAREAVNAPSDDLLAFEKELKAKHDEYKAKGIVPKLRTESQTIKPKRLLRPKNMGNK